MRNQEKLYDLLDTLRAGVETAGTLALGTLGLACQGAERLAGGVKLRYEADALKAQLAGLNETLGRWPEAPACPGCGEAVGEGDHFCRSCGEKLD